MKVFYVTNKKPRSHNKNGSSDSYKKGLQDEFQSKYAHLYQDLPIKNTTLQARIICIHQFQKGCVPDVDNISKPIVDSFTGIIYEDDKLIIRRIADILERKDFKMMMFEATSMPLEIYQAFETYYSNNEKHIIFYEVTDFLPSQIKIGEL